MKSIRPFTKDDIPQIVDMFERLLLNETPSRRGLTNKALPAYFEQIFFHNPWYDEELPSLVYQGSDGRIIGFLGIVSRPMLLRDRPIRAAISFHLMVEPESRSSMAGVQLLKAFFSGPQDFSITDGAGQIGRAVWEGVGGTTSHLYSLRWTRVLQPSRQAANMLRSRIAPGKNGFISYLTEGLSPLLRLTDIAAAKIAPRLFSPISSSYTEEELDTENFLAKLPAFSRSSLLQPVYDNHTIKWLFEQANQMSYFGEFKKILVRDAKLEVAGWYLYYVKPGRISQVIHFAARKNSVGDILDHMFDHARRHGSSAISGRLEPRFMQDLSDRFCFFTRTGPWTLLHSNNTELLHVIQGGNAFLTGLEGEWCLLF